MIISPQHLLFRTPCSHEPVVSPLSGLTSRNRRTSRQCALPPFPHTPPLILTPFPPPPQLLPARNLVLFVTPVTPAPSVLFKSPPPLSALPPHRKRCIGSHSTSSCDACLPRALRVHLEIASACRCCWRCGDVGAASAQPGVGSRSPVAAAAVAAMGPELPSAVLDGLLPAPVHTQRSGHRVRARGFTHSVECP